MRILVIDDRADQLENAVRQLGNDHEVVTANGWSSGYKALKSGAPKWDLVLTDLSMPAEKEGMSPEGLRHVGKSTPYGFPLALLALKWGVPKAAIVSNGQADDGNHHEHPIYWACDDLHGEIIPGRLWAFTGYKCPYMEDEGLPGVKDASWVKDWATVMKTVLGTI